jgi:autotransporter-associated beta strand protein
MTLSGANTYDGTTTVSAGTLVAASNTALGTATGNTTVTAGTLEVTNDDVFDDAATVSIASGATLDLTHSGTDKVGVLIVGGVTQAGGVYTFGTGKLEVSSSTPFETWADSKGLDGTAGKENGMNDDPDKDGRTNLAEFAFNGNPLSGSDNGQVYLLTADSDADGDTDKELILTLAVRKTTPAFTAGAPATAPLTDGILYKILGSTNLAAFGVTVTPVGLVDPGVALTDATNYEYRSFSLSGSNGLVGKGFLRASAEAP